MRGMIKYLISRKKADMKEYITKHETKEQEQTWMGSEIIIEE